MKSVGDKILSNFISYSFLLVAINRVATLPMFVTYQNVIAGVQWCIYFVLFVRTVKFILLKGNILFTSYSIAVFLYLVSCAYSILRGLPINLIISHEIVWTLLYFLPIGLATFSIQNYDTLFNCLYKVSYPIAILCLFYSTYRLYINPFGNTYDMAFGYILLVPTLFHCCEFKKTHNFILLIFIIVEIIFLILFASRGVVIGLVSYILGDFLLKLKTRRDKIKFLIPLSLIVISYFSLPIINDYLETHNIYSRTLYKLATGDKDDETHGRTHHWDVGLDLVKEQPIMGYGLGGYYYDFYYAISNKYPSELYSYDIESESWVKATASVSGTHSGFIEILLFFGILIGLPLSLWLIFSIFNIRDVNNQYVFDLALIFYCSYIIGNMIVGGGIFTKPGCAIFIFLMIKIKSKSFRLIDKSSYRMSLNSNNQTFTI